MPDNPLGYLLAYYLAGLHGNTLIDTGWNEEGARAALEEQLALCGGRLEEIEQVLVTHCHPDHGGTGRAHTGAGGSNTGHAPP
ncbi:MAG: MBL fold metallo-hydrolase [Moorella sp. (in: Bacteria)]|nr:MBL fold metallo-hydrolase [Moorella sp. (in: firmicutes)]